MENTELHTEKVKILSRLIKETSLTLEEALLLLKEEEQEEQLVEQVVMPQTSTGTWTTIPSPYYGTPSTFHISSSGNVGMATTSPSGTYTSSFTSLIADTEDSAPDLNN